MAKRRLLDVVEGFYLSHIVYHLHRQGVFASLSGKKTVTEIADELGYDRALFSALLDFVYQTTDILRRSRSDRYSLNSKYLSYQRLGFHLDKFIGTYGPAFTQLEASLHSPTLGSAFVNKEMLTQAFMRLETPGISFNAHLLREWNVKSLLDLGCGPATLLMELCLADPSFRGWGVDESTSMYTAAVERVATAGLANRIHVIQADVRQLATHIPPNLRDEIGALYGRSLLNEFFRLGSAEAVSFINDLKKLFPGRLLFVMDYYGKLTHTRSISLRYQHTLIHDLAQAVSAQGVPPPDLQTWAMIYDAAECSILHAYEGENDGIRWFAHVVQL